MASLVLVLLALMHCAAASTPPINGSSGGGFSLRVVAKQPLLDGDGDFASLQRAVKQVRCRIRHRLLSAGVAGEYDTDEIRPSMCPVADNVYAALVGIGPDSQFYQLELDMTSSLTWMQCVPCHPCLPQLSPVFDPTRSSTFHKVPQNSELCRAPYTGHSGVCFFTARYRQKGTAVGYLGKDTFSFPTDRPRHHDVPGIVFGCAFQTTNFQTYDSAAGVLGLGMGKVGKPATSLMQQIYHGGGRFSYCPITPGSAVHSYLRFGIDIPPPLPNVPRQSVNVYPPTPNSEAYYVGLEGVSVDGVRLRAVRLTMFVTEPNGGGGCVIDVGTKMSSIIAPAYDHIATAVRDHLRSHGARFVEAPLHDHQVCVERTPAIERHLPSMTLHFLDGAALRVAPRNMFVPVNSHGHQAMCLGLVRDTFMTVIGAMQQIDTRFVFDLQGATPTMRFSPEDCHLDAQ